MTKKRQTRTIATGVGVALLGGMCIFAPEARSADHLDGDVTSGDPVADIADVYTFLDGSNVVLAMTVFPFATATGVDGGAAPAFSNAVQYVFHTQSGAAFGTTSDPVDVICTFKSATSVQCWVGTADYVTGDPSMASKPLASASGKVKVFAGLRGDPFHFDLQGFVDVETAAEAAVTAKTLTFDTSGCPTNVPASLATVLSETTSSANPAKKVADDFAGADVLGLVVSVDKSLLTKGGALVSVWGATYQ